MVVSEGLSGVLLGHPEGVLGVKILESPLFASYTVCLLQLPK